MLQNLEIPWCSLASSSTAQTVSLAPFFLLSLLLAIPFVHHLADHESIHNRWSKKPYPELMMISLILPLALPGWQMIHSYPFFEGLAGDPSLGYMQLLPRNPSHKDSLTVRCQLQSENNLTNWAWHVCAFRSSWTLGFFFAVGYKSWTDDIHWNGASKKLVDSELSNKRQLLQSNLELHLKCKNLGVSVCLVISFLLFSPGAPTTELDSSKPSLRESKALASNCPSVLIDVFFF